MVSVVQQTFRAISNFNLKRLGTTNILVLPNPSNVTFNPGIVEVVSSTRNRLGEQVEAASYIDENKPVFTCTIANVLEVMGIRLGKQMTLQSYSSKYSQQLTVTSTNKTYAGAASGEIGNGLLADQADSIAYVLGDNGISTVLTRIADATIDQATDTQSFSQGADGSFKLTDDLIGSTVKLEFPISLTSQPKLSETSDTFFEVSFETTTINGAIYRLAMESARIDLANSGDVGGPEIDLAFNAVYDGSSCRPVTLEYLGQVPAC